MGAMTALHVTTVLGLATLASCSALALDNDVGAGFQPGTAVRSTPEAATTCTCTGATPPKNLLPLWIVLGVVGGSMTIAVLLWGAWHACVCYYRVRYNVRRRRRERAEWEAQYGAGARENLAEAGISSQDNVQLEQPMSIWVRPLGKASWRPLHEVQGTDAANGITVPETCHAK
ncbi:hypothetical protein LQW54_002747 [Pestalotiopsis sp. IQ-011]